MPAVLIPLAIAAASSIYQGIKGAQEKRKARAMQADADAEYRSNLADSRRMALTGMPEAEYQKALQNISRNQSATLSALGGRRSALAGATTAQQATNDAILGLTSQDAQMRRQAENAALGQGNRYAAYKAGNAANERASGEALTGAAISNAFNTATTAAYLGAAGAFNKNAPPIDMFGTGTYGGYGGYGRGMSPAGGASIFGPGGYRGMGLYTKPY